MNPTIHIIRESNASSMPPPSKAKEGGCQTLCPPFGVGRGLGLPPPHRDVQPPPHWEWIRPVIERDGGVSLEGAQPPQLIGCQLRTVRRRPDPSSEEEEGGRGCGSDPPPPFTTTTTTLEGRGRVGAGTATTSGGQQTLPPPPLQLSPSLLTLPWVHKSSPST